MPNEPSVQEQILNDYPRMTLDDQFAFRLADASLITAGESLNISRIFTLDRHFYAYRVSGDKTLQVVP